MNPSKVPYRKRDGLSGTVWDKKDNISQHAKIRVTNFPSFGLYETQSDEKGDFNIEFASEIVDFKFLNVDAYDAPGKTSLNAKIDFSYIEAINALLREESGHNNEQKIRDIKNYGEPDLVYVLRFGPGKFRTSHLDKRKKYNPYQYSRYTDVMDIIQDIQPYRLSGNRIIFSDRSKNRTDSVSMEEAIIVINGLLKGNDISVLKTIVPSDITNINISNFLLDVHKYTPLNFGSVIEITTIQGLYKYRQSPVQMGPGILSAERTFYSPDYSLESSTSTDNRRTLYWNPKLNPKQGNSMLVTFYTSDVKGLFSGKLVGFDKDGNPVEGSFTFRVE
jgi:hypothetical protein